jgi:hypothetical protein
MASFLKAVSQCSKLSVFSHAGAASAGTARRVAIATAANFIVYARIGHPACYVRGNLPLARQGIKQHRAEALRGTLR